MDRSAVQLLLGDAESAFHMLYSIGFAYGVFCCMHINRKSAPSRCRLLGSSEFVDKGADLRPNLWSKTWQ
jgi:hypothetical protein